MDIYQSLRSGERSNDQKDLDLAVDFVFQGHLVTRSNKSGEKKEILNYVSEINVKGQSVMAEGVSVAGLVDNNAKPKYMIVQRKPQESERCGVRDDHIEDDGDSEDSEVRRVYVQDEGNKRKMDD